MSPSRWLVWLCAGLACCGVSGCEYLPFGKPAAQDLDDFSDLEDPDSPSSPVADSQPTSEPTAASLDLQLQPGQRFPLIKTVEQRVTQQEGEGAVLGRSKLELVMSLVVEDVRQDQRKIGVRYHRVRFAQDLGGQVSEFNSDSPSTSIPAEAVPYAGLKDNGFSFWLGPQHEVLELVGFAEFLDRCVAHVPVDQKEAVLTQLRSTRGEDGLASFVDDSIGLLPRRDAVGGAPLQRGTTWEMPSRSASQTPPGSPPLPPTKCFLTDLTPQYAEITMQGYIPPSTIVDEQRGVRLLVRGGQTMGTCTVDRITGMPTRSRVERSIEILAQLRDGTEIPQRKEIVTTILAFLEQGADRPSAQAREQKSRQSLSQREPAPARPW